MVTRLKTDLNPETCRRARLSRDRRFDGEFFLGVTTTGIYCRPICPARQAAEANVRYFHYAAQAAEAGFRPCLRCRPESAPGSPAWLGSATTVQRALGLIRSGALDGDRTVADLASRLGVGERYLRKLFQRELGTSPLAVAQHQRVLLARQLLMESAMSLTDIAFSSGFGSVRRFNSALRSTYGDAPGALRRGKRVSGDGHARLSLVYRPPYDWEGVIGFFGRHAVDGVEQIVEGSDVQGGDQHYRARVVLHGKTAELAVSHVPDRCALEVRLALPVPCPLQSAVVALRRMFDLDANPDAIGEVLGDDPLLAALLQRFPGIRAPGNWSAPESAVRAVIGQQVSTAAARGICGSLAAACAGAGPAVFPDPSALLALPDSSFPMPGKRRATLRTLGNRDAGDDAAWHADALAQLAGIGPWTAAMVALRGHGDPDAFPASDLGLLRAWERLGGKRADLAARAEAWRPFRGYAANLLWRSLG